MQGDCPHHVGRTRLLAVGGAVQMTSSRSTRSTAPPPARNGSPVSNSCAGPDQRAGAERGVELVSAEGQEVGVGRQGAVRRQLGGVDEHGDTAFVGGPDDLLDRRQPAGTFDAPVTASRAGGRGPASRAAATSSTPKLPSVPHSTYRRVATRPQGSRLAWCSTAVVTTTSSGRGGDGRRGGRWPPSCCGRARRRRDRPDRVRRRPAPPGGPARSPRWPVASGSRPPGGRSSTRAGTRRPGRPRPGGPGSRRPGRVPRRGARRRPDRGPGRRRRPGGRAVPRRRGTPSRARRWRRTARGNPTGCPVGGGTLRSMHSEWSTDGSDGGAGGRWVARGRHRRGDASRGRPAGRAGPRGRRCPARRRHTGRPPPPSTAARRGGTRPGPARRRDLRPVRDVRHAHRRRPVGGVADGEDLRDVRGRRRAGRAAGRGDADATTPDRTTPDGAAPGDAGPRDPVVRGRADASSRYLRLPQNMASISAIAQQAVGHGHVARLLDLGGRLRGLPEQVVEVREPLEVLRLEVVGPQHPEVVLDQVGPLLLDDGGGGFERLVVGRVGTSPSSP